jgi:hypothetical protein
MLFASAFTGESQGLLHPLSFAFKYRASLLPERFKGFQPVFACKK